MHIEERIADAIAHQTESVRVPAPDLIEVRRQGARRRAGRTGVAIAATLALVGGGYVATSALAGGAGGDRETELQAATLTGTPDLSKGARAYFDWDNKVLHWGGATVENLPGDEFDTSAVATPEGVVFRGGNEMLVLRPDGTTQVLGELSSADVPYVTVEASLDFSRVAWTDVGIDGSGTLSIASLTGDPAVETVPIPCDVSGCKPGPVLVEAVTDERVFMQTESDGLYYDEDGGFAKVDGMRIVDARGQGTDQTMLTGDPVTAQAENDLPGWRFVQADNIDRLLTFDGNYQIGRSAVLQPTRPGLDPITLRIPQDAQGPFLTNVDTDGSVLIAYFEQKGDPWRAAYFDCEVPSGACERIGTTDSGGSYPMFLGNGE